MKRLLGLAAQARFNCSPNNEPLQSSTRQSFYSHSVTSREGTERSSRTLSEGTTARNLIRKKRTQSTCLRNRSRN